MQRHDEPVPDPSMPSGLRIASVLLLLVTAGRLVPLCALDDLTSGSPAAHASGHAEAPSATGADEDCCTDCVCCGLTFVAADPAPLATGFHAHGYHVSLASPVRLRPPWAVWHPPRA